MDPHNLDHRLRNLQTAINMLSTVAANPNATQEQRDKSISRMARLTQELLALQQKINERKRNQA